MRNRTLQLLLKGDLRDVPVSQSVIVFTRLLYKT